MDKKKNHRGFHFGSILAETCISTGFLNLGILYVPKQIKECLAQFVEPWCLSECAVL